jgi:hypothetical protein
LSVRGRGRDHKSILQRVGDRYMVGINLAGAGAVIKQVGLYLVYYFINFFILFRAYMCPKSRVVIVP